MTSKGSMPSPEQMCSAAGRSKSPANTDARSNTSCSSSDNNWYDHVTVACNVW